MSDWREGGRPGRKKTRPEPKKREQRKSAKPEKHAKDGWKGRKAAAVADARQREHWHEGYEIGKRPPIWPRVKLYIFPTILVLGAAWFVWWILFQAGNLPIVVFAPTNDQPYLQPDFTKKGIPLVLHGPSNDFDRWRAIDYTLFNGKTQEGRLVPLLELNKKKDLVDTITARSKTLGGPGNNTVVLFISAASGVDGDGKPVLYIPGIGGTVFLHHVFEAFLRSHPRADKLIAIDSCRFQQQWGLGQLSTTFASAVRHLVDDLKKGDIASDRRPVENLNVFLACDDHQRSWMVPNLQCSIFSHYFALGLRGAADGAGTGRPDGKVYSQELVEYVRRHVAEWVISRRDAIQTPVALGTKTNLDGGQIDDFGLTWGVETDRRGQSDETKAKANPSEQFGKIDDLAKRISASEDQIRTANPLAWAHLQNGLVQLERIVLAGGRFDDEFAKSLTNRLESQSSDRPGQAGRSIAALSVCSAAEFGEYRDWVDSFLGRGGPPIDGESKKELPPPRDRQRVAEEVWRRLRGMSAVNQSKLKFAVDAILRCGGTDGNDVEFVEIHFLKLLRDHIDWDATKAGPEREALSKTVARAIQARDRSQRIANLAFDGQKVSDPRLHYFVRAILDRADVRLRLAEDWLFAGQSDVAAKEYRRLIEDGPFAEAEAIANTVAKAYNIHDRAVAAAPWFGRWLLDSAADLDSVPEAIYVPPLWERVSRLVSEAKDLHKVLEATRSEFAQQLYGANATSTEKEYRINSVDLDELDSMANYLEDNLEKLDNEIKSLADAVDPAASRGHGPMWRRAVLALECPLINETDRAEIHEKIVGALRDEKEPVQLLGEGSSGDRKEVSKEDKLATWNRFSLADYEAELVKLIEMGMHPAWLAVQDLSDKGTPDEVVPKTVDEAGALVVSRLKNIKDELKKYNKEEWTEKSGTLVQIRNGQSELGFRTRASASLLVAYGADDDLMFAAEIAWRIDRYYHHLWLAERALDDFWGDGRRPTDHSGSPYFSRLATRLMSDASLGADNDYGRYVERKRTDRREAARGFKVAGPPPQINLPVDAPDAEFRLIADLPGAMPLERAGQTVSPTTPTGQLRLRLVGEMGFDRVSIGFRTSADRTSVPSRVAAVMEKPIGGQGLEITATIDPKLVDRITPELYFRGHIAQSDRILIRTADSIEVLTEGGPYGRPRVTVSGDGKQVTNVLFVLDCSGSMKTKIPSKEGPRMTKIEAAQEKMNEILQYMGMQNTFRVGVMVYGARFGWGSGSVRDQVERSPFANWLVPAPGKYFAPTSPFAGFPEEDCYDLVPLSKRVLTKAGAGEIHNELTRLTYWGQTPLYYSIQRAVKTIRAFDREADSIVLVVTDGADDYKVPRNLTKDCPRVHFEDVEELFRRTNFDGLELDFVTFAFGKDDNEEAVTRVFTRLLNANQKLKGGVKSAKDPLELRDWIIQRLEAHVATFAVSPTPADAVPRLERVDFGKTWTGRTAPVVAEDHTIRVEQMGESYYGPKITLLGWEDIHLVFDSTAVSRRGRLVFKDFRTRKGRTRAHATDGQRRLRNLEGAAGDAEYDVFALEPSREGEGQVFEFAFQSSDLNRFSKPPRRIWCEITPIESLLNSERVPVPDSNGQDSDLTMYRFCDFRFEQDEPVPVITLRAPRWPRSATAAAVRFWIDFDGPRRTDPATSPNRDGQEIRERGKTALRYSDGVRVQAWREMDEHRSFAHVDTSSLDPIAAADVLIELVTPAPQLQNSRLRNIVRQFYTDGRRVRHSFELVSGYTGEVRVRVTPVEQFKCGAWTHDEPLKFDVAK